MFRFWVYNQADWALKHCLMGITATNIGFIYSSICQENNAYRRSDAHKIIFSVNNGQMQLLYRIHRVTMAVGPLHRSMQPEWK